MARIRCTDVQARPTEFLDCTSVTLDEFPQLVPPFEAAYQAHLAAWRKAKQVASAASAGAASGTIAAEANEGHGNRHSHVYRVPGCKGDAGMNPASVVPVATEAEVQQAGYHRAKDCP